jgi:tetratricopeptide (TPR) repeat protein
MDLSAILQSLATNRRAGRLVVRRPDGREKHLYLVKGRVRLITATDIDADREALSCALLRSSIMTLDEIESSMAAAAESKAPLNQFLTEHLATLGSSAGKALDNSTHQEVLDLFSWRSMHCEFFTYESDSPQAILCAGLPGAGLSVERLVMAAVTRADEWEAIRQYFDPEIEVFKPTETGRERSGNRTLDRLIGLVDGKKDVAEVRELAQDDPLETCKVLLDLYRTKRIEPRNAAELANLAGTYSSRRDWRKVSRLCRRAIELDPSRTGLLLIAADACDKLQDLDGLRMHLSEYASRMFESSDFAEAIKACDRLLKAFPQDADARMMLFRALRARGDHRRSRSAGKELVLALERRGAFDLAGDILNQLRSEFPDDEELEQLDVWIRLVSTEISDAAIEYREMARAFAEEGDTSEAVKFSVQAWAKTLGARAARLEHEVDLLRHEVGELRGENEDFRQRSARLRKQLSDARNALKSIEVAYQARRKRSGK